MKIVTGLILSPVTNEFVFKGPYLKLGQNIGLLLGAVFWGIGSDVWGRKCASFFFFSLKIDLEECAYFARLAFNLTLFITGVFAVSAGASPDSVALCSLAAVWSIGVGGNLPVDSAVFLGMASAFPMDYHKTHVTSRIHPGIASISVDRPLHLVGSRTTCW